MPIGNRACLVLEGVQQFIERYCHRTFALTDYDEQQVVRQDGSIILKQFPVQRLNRVCFFNMGWLLVSSSAPIATVSTTETDTTVMAIANGIRVDTTLTYEQYPTLGALAAAISSVASFSASCEAARASFPSSDIVAMQYGSCASTSPTVLSQWEDFQGSLNVQPSGIIWSMLPLGLATGYSTPTAVQLNMFRDFRVRLVHSGVRDNPRRSVYGDGEPCGSSVQRRQGGSNGIAGRLVVYLLQP